jgi:glycosyltransferase involved in cell wall biosynthesis
MALVSVIVPAFNAEDTLSETLDSVRAQTLRDLEIIIVDDGSTDRTAAVAARHAEEDTRVKRLTSANSGVARARNLAIASAEGAYVAPIDADDIWHPRKLELQLARLQASPDAGLAYSWFRRINERGVVIGASPSPVVEGGVFHRHLAANFVSNGSAPLIRREALEAVSYDPALRDVDAEGCEDYLLQLRIARRWPFACAPGFLVGYRRRSGAMSNNVVRMIRSHIEVFGLMHREAPTSAMPIIRRRLAGFHVELARNRLRRARFVEAARASRRALQYQPWEAVVSGLEQIPLVFHRQPGPMDARPFEAWPLDIPNGSWRPDRRLLDRYAARLDLDPARRDG